MEDSWKWSVSSDKGLSQTRITSQHRRFICLQPDWLLTWQNTLGVFLAAGFRPGNAQSCFPCLAWVSVSHGALCHSEWVGQFHQSSFQVFFHELPTLYPWGNILLSYDMKSKGYPRLCAYLHSLEAAHIPSQSPQGGGGYFGPRWSVELPKGKLLTQGFSREP